MNEEKQISSEGIILGRNCNIFNNKLRIVYSAQYDINS